MSGSAHQPPTALPSSLSWLGGVSEHTRIVPTLPKPPQLAPRDVAIYTNQTERQQTQSVVDDDVDTDIPWPRFVGHFDIHERRSADAHQELPALEKLDRTISPTSGKLEQLPVCTTPVLLACEQKKGNALRSLTVNCAFCNFIFFTDPVKFTRWLFNEASAHTPTPPAVLVVGWREAKPCISAIEAVFTGNTFRLRPDAQRPSLPNCAPGARRRVAVATVVVLPLNEKQICRSHSWAAWHNDHSLVRVEVAEDELHLQSLTLQSYYQQLRSQ